jgi:hypothetical protein
LKEDAIRHEDDAAVKMAFVFRVVKLCDLQADTGVKDEHTATIFSSKDRDVMFL